VSIAQAPAVEVFRSAQKARKERRFEESRRLFETLLNADPMEPGIVIPYAEVLVESGAPGLAYHVLANMQPIMADAPGLMGNLGVALAKCGLRDQAKDVYLKAVEMHPKDYFSWANLGSIHINRGAPEDALRYSDEALRVKPDFNAAKWTRSLALLELGRLAEGWDAYEVGMVADGPGDQPHRATRNYWTDTQGDTPLWDGTPGKKVVVYGEQGVGDEIMFASILPELIRDCREVVFDCHERMAPLMRRSFPGLKVYGTRKHQNMEWPILEPDIEAQIPIGSLGKFYRRDVGSFPQHTGYLKPDPVRVEALRERLEALPGEGPIVGVAWYGGHDLAHQKMRTIPLDEWGPVLKQPCRFVSVQYSTQEKGRNFPTYQGVEAGLSGIAHWQSVIDEFDELNNLIAACDLIISNNQTAIHQAGALGKEVWVLTPEHCAWRYSTAFGEKMPWYPTATVIRQGKAQDGWGELMGRVGAKLHAKLGLNGVIHAGSDQLQRSGMEEVRP
jgi:tetratricopeptide (TPR) repeat protein